LYEHREQLTIGIQTSNPGAVA